MTAAILDTNVLIRLVMAATTTFFSFDKNAVNRLSKRGLSALLLQ